MSLIQIYMKCYMRSVDNDVCDSPHGFVPAF